MNDLPARLIGGVVFQEVGGDPTFAEAGAYWARRKGLLRDRSALTTSFGAVSIQLRRTAETFGRDPEELTPNDYELLIQALKDPLSNIQISAAHLADIRDKLPPGKGAQGWTDEEIELVATAYNRGPDLSREELQQNLSYGKAVKKHLQEVDDALAGPPSDTDTGGTER